MHLVLQVSCACTALVQRTSGLGWAALERGRSERRLRGNTEGGAAASGLFRLVWGKRVRRGD